MRKFHLSIGGKNYRAYEGRHCFNDFSREITKGHLKMLSFADFSQALTDANTYGGRDADGLFYLAGKFRVWMDVGLLWCRDLVYVWDHPGKDSSGNIVICRKTADFFLDGNKPDENGITWYSKERGAIRSLPHVFATGLQSLEELAVNPLMVAVDGQLGANMIQIVYGQIRDKPSISGFEVEELDSDKVTAVSFRGPSMHEGLSINPDSDPHSVSESLALAHYNSRAQRGSQKRGKRALAVPRKRRALEAVGC